MPQILKVPPTVEELTPSLKSIIQNCTFEWNELQKANRISRNRAHLMTVIWRKKCEQKYFDNNQHVQDMTYKWLQECVKLHPTELNSDQAMNHFWNLVKLPEPAWLDYFRSAQTQIVAGRTRYSNPSTDPIQIAPESSEILESMLKANAAANVPNVKNAPKLTKHDSRSTFLQRQNEWATVLTSVFLSKGVDVIQEEEIAKDKWLSVLDEMKGISEGTYHETEWYLAFKESKLCGVFNALCNPNYPVRHARVNDCDNPHYRITWYGYYALAEVIGVFQEEWTPEMIKTQWITDWEESPHENYQQQKQHAVKYTKFDWKKQPVKIFQAMTWENVIPLEAFPSHVYTFLSQDNFIHVWNRSIAPGLDERHVDLEGMKPSILYQVIHRWMNEYEKLCNDVQGWSPGLCQHCLNQPQDQRCIQDHFTIFKTKEQLKREFPNFDLEGAGISCVPEDQQVEPVTPPVIRKADGSIKIRKPLTEIYHPDRDLHLTLIQSNPTIIKRCGRHIFRIMDSKTQKMFEFVYFNPFPADILQEMANSTEEDCGVKALNRGRSDKMLYWTRGSMVPLGSRVPMGGDKGTSYGAYQGMSAEDEHTIRLMFRHAKDSLPLLEAARSVDSNLVRNLKDAATTCDRLGASGANLYKCQGYQAPIHIEDDASRGLCAQVWWKGIEEWNEWGFVNLQLGYYIATRANTLWSFNSSHMHGTNLPSQNSLIRSNQWAWEAVDDEESDVESEESNDDDDDDEQHIGAGGTFASKHTREPSSASETLINATGVKRLRGGARARRRRIRLAGSGGFHVSTPKKNASTAQRNAGVRGRAAVRRAHYDQA
ncbi:uncharacterized protein C8R40DRAFT_1067833 [Lentinula edodes]|uniref:uncharacterized protein n=1 Tax=Lentinula edodes TaxID=5353 RepID=UPI001E8CC810|nr:uncharacterized protein C8R40DRAFT_1067833 [Lentinula edodes]KAH7877665.1 hypothetical protein C8R40DRAFT_1067833 [Lentinula edodes]